MAADIREIRPIRRLQLTRRRHLVRRIAGQHLINSRRVIKQPIRRVTHRSNQSSLVERLRHHRHVLADMRPFDLGWNRLKFAAYVRRRIRLRIPNVDMRRPALQKDHDHALRLAETPRTRILAGGGALVGRRRLLGQKVRQTQAHHADGPDPHQLPPRNTITVTNRTSRNRQHIFSPYQLYKNALLFNSAHSKSCARPVREPPAK